MTFDKAYETHIGMLETMKKENTLTPEQLAFEMTVQHALRMQVTQVITVGRYDEAYCPNCDTGLSNFIGDGIYHHNTDMTMCIYCGQKITIKEVR